MSIHEIILLDNWLYSNSTFMGAIEDLVQLTYYYYFILLFSFTTLGTTVSYYPLPGTGYVSVASRGSEGPTDVVACPVPGSVSKRKQRQQSLEDTQQMLFRTLHCNEPKSNPTP